MVVRVVKSGYSLHFLSFYNLYRAYHGGAVAPWKYTGSGLAIVQLLDVKIHPVSFDERFWLWVEFDNHLFYADVVRIAK
jgi:hypothetical protein